MKKFPTTLKLAFALGFTCVAISLRAQNVVVDGGFEASADGVGAHPFVPPWVAVDSSGFTNVGGDGLLPGGDSHTGANYANLGAFQTTGTLSQTLNTAPGSRYTLSFWLANNIPSSPGAPNSFQAFFGGSMVFATPVTSPPFTTSGVYQLFSFANLLATGSSTLLQFQFRNDNDFWRLDDISAVATPEGGAPLWLAIPIFGGLCLLHSRLQRRQVCRS